MAIFFLLSAILLALVSADSCNGWVSKDSSATFHQFLGATTYTIDDLNLWYGSDPASLWGRATLSATLSKGCITASISFTVDPSISYGVTSCSISDPAGNGLSFPAVEQTSGTQSYNANVCGLGWRSSTILSLSCALTIQDCPAMLTSAPTPSA